MTTATTTSDFQSWSHGQLQLVEAALQRVLPAAEIAPQRLHQAMRYAVLSGGKRVRPLLAFAAGELAHAEAERVALAGAAVELIHAYSLVHDDLPCMDDDELRRGRPTCPVRFGEALALFEEGVVCLRAAAGTLSEAETRVKRLRELADGAFVVEELRDDA